MINPQKGIDLINNDSIINRILFAITIFQHKDGLMRVLLARPHYPRVRMVNKAPMQSILMVDDAMEHTEFFKENGHACVNFQLIFDFK
jgi:hypothetical protein